MLGFKLRGVKLALHTSAFEGFATEELGRPEAQCRALLFFLKRFHIFILIS